MLYNVKLTQFNRRKTYILRKTSWGATSKYAYLTFFVRKFSENSDQKLQKTNEKFDLRQIYAEYMLMGLESYRAYYAYHA
jgi:hypothetical protein